MPDPSNSWDTALCKWLVKSKRIQNEKDNYILSLTYLVFMPLERTRECLLWSTGAEACWQVQDTGQQKQAHNTWPGAAHHTEPAAVWESQLWERTQGNGCLRRLAPESAKQPRGEQQHRRVRTWKKRVTQQTDTLLSKRRGSRCRRCTAECLQALCHNFGAIWCSKMGTSVNIVGNTLF